jgi:hypothetical protein
MPFEQMETTGASTVADVGREVAAFGAEVAAFEVRVAANKA